MSTRLSCHRTVTVVCLVWSLLLGAFMPALAHAALAWAAPEIPVEVCTRTGLVRLAPEAPADTPSSKTGMALHCQVCILGAHDGLALPPPDLALTLPALSAPMPVAFYRASVTASVWLAALSRGPPAFV